MKTIKKIGLFWTLLLTTTFSNYSMKREHQEQEQEQEAKQTISKQIIGQAQLPSGEWVDIVGLILSQDAPMQLLLTNFEFNQLLPELQVYIVESLASNSNATTLEEAAKTINALARTNKKLNQLINDPQFCLKLIKHLAWKFQCADEKAANTLQTKAAKKRSALQDRLIQYFLRFPKKTLQSLSSDKGFLSILDSLSQQDIDLNYTYALPDDIPTQDLSTCVGMTALMFSISCKNLSLTRRLLEKGAHINAINPCGRTALMIAVSEANVEAVKFLIAQPNINIDQQEFEFGDTALCIACMQYESDTEKIKAAKKEMVRLLLEAGANPELGNPLEVAESHGAEESYDLVNQALKRGK